MRMHNVAKKKYSGPFCQDKKSACVKIQNPPLLLAKNLGGTRAFHAPLRTTTVSSFGLLLTHCSQVSLAKIDGSRGLIVQRLM
jgi:hypothetical protein